MELQIINVIKRFQRIFQGRQEPALELYWILHFFCCPDHYFTINFNFHIFKQMYSEMSTIKIKSKTGQSIASHLNTYQGQSIRKSICQDLKHQKSSQRMFTEQSQKCLGTSSDMKKIIRQFRLPFKSNSPNFKKKNQPQHSQNHNKLGLSINKPSKKRTQAQIKPLTKSNTEAGPIIKKKKTGQQKTEKKIISIMKEDSKQEQRKQKGSVAKKLTECKSVDRFSRDLKEKSQTFDSTPMKLVEQDLDYLGLVGQGTFGKVFRAQLKRNGQIVAVKKVFQDPKYKNRQFQIVSMLESEFTMRVLGTFSTAEEGSQYLNIVMEYYECDLYSHIKASKKPLPTFQIKLLTYQAFRGLLYIHSLGICHRDIKPHNLLLDENKLVVCDFGSAKILTNQPNLPYICSRCYRAPELIFGATHYTTMIDIWSLGCVILEMLHGVPLFIGESSIDHLIEIIKVMGTPTKTQVIQMNPQYDLNDYKFPKVKKREWKHIFPKADPLLLDLLAQVMIYSPKQRLNAAQALSHQFYDELRNEKVGKQLQKQLGRNLFDFSYGQVRGNEHLLPKLIPQWVKSY